MAEEEEGESDDSDEEDDQEEESDEDEEDEDEDESCFLRGQSKRRQGNSAEAQRSRRLSRLSSDASRAMLSLDRSLANAVMVASWQQSMQ